jgi:hypothetical protein
MIGKVKTWLGIEGVKIDLDLPEEFRYLDGLVTGKLYISSMSDHVVTSIHIKLIEKYSRGKKEAKLTDEFDLGQVDLIQDIEIPANKRIQLSFELPFTPRQSGMDTLQSSNMVMDKIVKAVKWYEGVSSIFRVEATAKVKGVALDPFDKELIVLL